jgi:hypothetical protein
MEAEEDDGTRFEVSGRGNFPRAVSGVDATAPIEACASCHIDNADEDLVFERLYAIRNVD